MKRVTLRLAITLLTFLIGVVITWLLAARPFRPIDKMPVSAPTVAELQVKPKHPEGWKKIEVDNEFSFYVPPDTEQVDSLPGCPFGTRKDFGSQSLWVSYDYIPKEMMEYDYRGKLSCEVMMPAYTRGPMYRISGVEVGGRRAMLLFRQWDNPKLRRMTLCFPNLGDGAMLRLSASSEDEQALDIAHQVFDSLEFR